LEQALVTYGDGLGNIDIRKLHDFHNSDRLIGTVTAVRPPARFGVLESLNGLVTHFAEKSQVDSGWINGGFFVLNQEVTNFIHSDDESFEFDVMPRLVVHGQLKAFHHEGFWQPMDTLREKENLEILAQQNPRPWLS
jgi:glucose-1-phosphate cytidylyltransferase